LWAQARHDPLWGLLLSLRLGTLLRMTLEFNSPTWRAVSAHANAQIATLREKNDSPSMDAIRTAETRGRIAAWKELLALDKPAPATTADVGGY